MVIDTPASEINPVIISDTLVTLTPSEPKPDSTKNVLTPAQVRFAPEEAVRQEVVLALQDKAHFTPDIVSSLFAREQEHFRKYVYRKQPTTWSDTASEKPTQLLAPVTQHDGRPYLYTMRKEGGTLSSAETTYLPEKDNLAREAFKTLSLHEKKDVLSYLVDIRYIKPQELIEDIATSEKDKSELLTHLMRKLYEQKGAYNYPRYNFAKTWEYDTIDPFVEAVIQKVQTHDLLQAIVAQPKDRLGVLGMVIGQKGVARVFQDIRTILDTKDLDPSLHAKLDLMGRQLLGNTEVPFHHSLQQFYEATHEAFKTYEAIADSITDQDVEIIQTETIPLIDSSEKVIVDDACGTGRDANRLATKQIEGVKEIIGLDISEIDLAKAQADYDALSGDKIPVRYISSDWKSLEGLEDKSVHILFGFGRSFMHATDEDDFKEILQRTTEKLVGGGVFACNFANPDKGAYLQNRRAHLAVLQRAGIPIGEEGLYRGISSTVDSPDGSNFVDRFTPTPESVISMAEQAGLVLIKTVTKPIPGERWKDSEGNPSEDIYFIFQKKAA